MTPCVRMAFSRAQLRKSAIGRTVPMEHGMNVDNLDDPDLIAALQSVRNAMPAPVPVNDLGELGRVLFSRGWLARSRHRGVAVSTVHPRAEMAVILKWPTGPQLQVNRDADRS